MPWYRVEYRIYYKNDTDVDRRDAVRCAGTAEIFEMVRKDADLHNDYAPIRAIDIQNVTEIEGPSEDEEEGAIY